MALANSPLKYYGVYLILYPRRVPICNIYIYQGSDKGGGVVQRLLVGTKRNAYGAQLQNSVHGPFFCSYKIQNTTFSDSENNSKSVLQNPMHLKLTNS